MNVPTLSFWHVMMAIACYTMTRMKQEQTRNELSYFVCSTIWYLEDIGIE
jgi:hypothetical protein